MGMEKYAVEGDILETADGTFFDVKGLTHPPERVIAFIRYYQDSSGDRIRGGRLYRKVYSLRERLDLSKRMFPEYLIYDPVFDERLCEVPWNEVRYVHNPIRFLRELTRRGDGIDSLERRALLFVETLKEESRVSRDDVGLSGSIMLGMHTKSSDIDPIIYGARSSRAVYEALRRLFREGEMVRAYDEEGLRRLFKFRFKDTKTGYEEFKRTESRKHVQGTFMGRDFFIRFVKKREEASVRYGDILYRYIGQARIRGRVIDASEAIFTPCRYLIDDVEVLEGIKVEPIKEVASFRGRFCEQAMEGEVIEAQGRLERVIEREGEEYFRVLLGGKTTDHMILKDG